MLQVLVSPNFQIVVASSRVPSAWSCSDHWPHCAIKVHLCLWLWLHPRLKPNLCVFSILFLCCRHCPLTSAYPQIIPVLLYFQCSVDNPVYVFAVNSYTGESRWPALCCCEWQYSCTARSCYQRQALSCFMHLVPWGFLFRIWNLWKYPQSSIETSLWQTSGAKQSCAQIELFRESQVQILSERKSLQRDGVNTLTCTRQYSLCFCSGNNSQFWIVRLLSWWPRSPVQIGDYLWQRHRWQ